MLQQFDDAISVNSHHRLKPILTHYATVHVSHRVLVPGC